MSEIIVVFDNATVILEDGEVLQITHAFDDDGDECGLEDAVSIVAGPDRGGRWMTIDIRGLEEVPFQ